LHTILHRTDLIVFPLTLQTITTSPMMSIWGKGGFTRYNQLSNRLYNRCDNHVERTATVHSTVLNAQPLFVQPVVKPRCTTGLKTGCIHDTAGCQTGCNVYTNIQLVVSRKRGWSISCLQHATGMQLCCGWWHTQFYISGQRILPRGDIAEGFFIGKI